MFLRYTVPERPILLFVDGHTSHMTLDVIDVARSNGVILFCLPPHTTHALQPLDVAVFKSLKDNFFKATRAVSFSKTNFIVTKREFAAMVKGPFEKAFSMVNIKAGFSKTGIFPFNPNAIDESKMKPSEVYHSPSSLDSSREGESPVFAQNTPSTSEKGPNVSSESSSCSYVPNTPTFVTVTPPLDVSTPKSGSGSIVNPLVRAGLVPTYLADIFTVPDDQSQSLRKRRRITKTRVLTEDEYVKMMKEKEAKENEAQELKKKRREERERKKEEREAQKKKKEEEKKQKGQSQEGKKGKGKSRAMKNESVSAVREEEEASSNSESEEPVRRSSRVRQPPSRFLRACSSDSDSDGETLCGLCNSRDPNTTQASIVYWVDCSNCGAWFHTACALGGNSSSRQFVCNNCL